MDISVIIVSWNVQDKLRNNLEALSETSGASFETIVVDNCSADATVEMIKKDFPAVQLIENQKNLGFAKACNQGIELSKGRYILLLNPDMQLKPDSLAKTLAWMNANPQAAICGIKLIDEHGNIIPHVRRFPTLLNQIAIILKLPHLFPRILDSYLRSDFDYNHASSVDSIRGAFFCIRREAFKKLGSLDERYFLWFEEVDYCRRARKEGLEVWYTPEAQAIDFVGQSFSQIKRSVKQNYFKHSMIAYFTKWHGWQGTALRFVWLIGDLISALGDLLHIKSRVKT